MTTRNHTTEFLPVNRDEVPKRLRGKTAELIAADVATESAVWHARAMYRSELGGWGVRVIYRADKAL